MKRERQNESQLKGQSELSNVTKNRVKRDQKLQKFTAFTKEKAGKHRHTFQLPYLMITAMKTGSCV